MDNIRIEELKNTINNSSFNVKKHGYSISDVDNFFDKIISSTKSAQSYPVILSIPDFGEGDLEDRSFFLNLRQNSGYCKEEVDQFLHNINNNFNDVLRITNLF